GGEELLELLPRVDGVLVAVAAVEDDDIDRRVLRDTEGVVIADVAPALGDRTAAVGVRIIAAAPGLAGAERDGTGAERRQGQEAAAGGAEPIERSHILRGRAHGDLFRR